jgi:membrane associated rhomboid family serine protease
VLEALIPIRDLNPTRRFPIWTVVIIAINVLVFLGTSHGLQTSEATAFRWGAIPCDVVGHCPVALDAALRQTFPNRSSILSVLTSMFMHANLFHIGFNMLFLWVFGNNVEDRLGRVRFPIFYLACGVIAALAFMLAQPNGTVPLVGASGAIAGILGAYALLWPRATIVSLLTIGIFFWPIRVRAWVMLGLWFVVQLLSSLSGLGQVEQGSGVAFLAHVGGFVAGLILIFPFGGNRLKGAVVHGDPYG